jgi:branched-chain amino acid transport system substrate-binding protein
MKKVLFVFLMLTLVLSACGQQAAKLPDECTVDEYGCAAIPAGQTIKIGMGAPLLGDYSMFGIDISQGANIAINADAGIEGFKFELVAEDDGGSAEGGAAVANKMVTDPTIVAIAGHIFSGATQAAMPIYEKAMIPMLSPSATNPPLTEQGSKVFNRTCFTDATQAKFAAKMMAEDLGIKKLAIMHDGSAYGQGLAELVQTDFEALGGEVVAFEAITPGEVDYSAPLSSIAGSAPEAVYFGGYAAEQIVMANQWAQSGLEGVTMFGCDGTFGSEFIEKTAANGEGAYAVSLVPPDSDAKVAFDAAYLAAYGIEAGSLSPYTWAAYDTAGMLLQAIKNVAILGKDGTLYVPRTALVNEVRNTVGYQGLTGTMTCDEVGECNASGPTFYKVDAGAWVPVQ